MASHVRTERHTAARNTILLWLAGVILFAGIGLLLTYHALRDSSIYASTMTPLMSERDQTSPAPTLKTVKVRQTDAAADIARAHSSAVASAKSEAALEPAAPAAEQPADSAPVTTPAIPAP